MRLPEVFNIFASYHYQMRQNPSFGSMVRGFFRIIAGRHADPYYQSNTLSAWPEYNNPRTATVPSNHIGVYDLFTLGIPWFLEMFFRLYWIPWTSPRVILRILSDQIVVILIAMRYTPSCIITVWALPVLAVVYLLREWKKDKSHHPTKKRHKK